MHTMASMLSPLVKDRAAIICPAFLPRCMHVRPSVLLALNFVTGKAAHGFATGQFVEGRRGHYCGLLRGPAAAAE